MVRFFNFFLMLYLIIIVGVYGRKGASFSDGMTVLAF